MRGFIINIRKVKNEDLIVTVLSSESVKNYWRFFGTRHSIIQIGNLIEFEVTQNKNGFMPNMRSISQHSFSWLFSEKHLFIWKNFIQLFEVHLNESPTIEAYYFNLLFQIAQKWDKQNPKRLAIEAYIQLLHKEKRIYYANSCYICQGTLENQVGLMRAFIPTHPSCVSNSIIDREMLFKLLHTKSTIHLTDLSVKRLYPILLKGL